MSAIRAPAHRRHGDELATRGCNSNIARSARAGTAISTASASATILDPSTRTLVLGSVASLTNRRTLVTLKRDGESILVVVHANRSAVGASEPTGLELVGPPGAVYAVSQSLNVFGADSRRERVIPLKTQDGSRIVPASGTDAVGLGGRIPWDRPTLPSSTVLEITINYN